MPALPTLTNENVLTYFISIGNNATALNSLVTDLQSNISTAINSRFSVSAWQQAAINAAPSAMTNPMIAILASQVSYWAASVPTSPPLQMGIFGVQDGATGAPLPSMTMVAAGDVVQTPPPSLPPGTSGVTYSIAIHTC
jgi:hypothetical protein